MKDLQLAKGVRDVFPEDKIVKNKVIGTFQTIFERYGFAPLETPAIERYETLAAKFAAGEASDALKEIFPVTDQAERKLALRFDLTVPLCRFVAMNKDLKFPFKRYEIGRVYRDGPIKLGRYREFWQCDIDIVGTDSMLAEAEILAMVQAAFTQLEIPIQIKINNRKILNGILAQVGITEKESAIISIDKLDKIGVAGVSAELQEKGCSSKQIAELFTIITKGITLDALAKKITNSEAQEGIASLQELFSYLKSMKVTVGVFDVSLARGLAYYTGTVFEAVDTSGTLTCSLAGGGRYDNMIGSFMDSKEPIPAMGISFGIEPIIDFLKLKQKSVRKSPAQMYIIPVGEVLADALALTESLRSAGINVSFSIGKKGVTKNLEYARSLGIPFVGIIGENEVAKKKITLRDMATGKEDMLTVKDVVKKVF